ncbi:MAG: hypothetical protein NUW09_05470 [Deltaproteobacteria bacterium]|nr:hypothetical protein [Deltaproteobacteria bacterium]
MMAGISDEIFREYDIRGIFGKDLLPETAVLIAKAYAVYIKDKGVYKDGFKVSVGRDVRTSSDAIRDALVAGLIQSGINVVDVGVCPTPLQYFSMHTLKVDGGFMITGSHNPPEYNGFKVSVGNETIHGKEIQRLKEIIKAGLKGAPSGKAGNVEKADIIPGYIDYVAGNIKLAAIKRPLKLVLDSGNGTAGIVAPELLRKLGCEIIELFSEPDGRFPNHHPDPTVPKNLKTLSETVVREKADFGVAYDGDADRLGVVDEAGNIVWGD